MSEKIKILMAFFTVTMNDLKHRMIPENYQNLVKESGVETDRIEDL